MKQQLRELLEGFTGDGALSPREAAEETIHRSVNRAGLLAQIWARSKGKGLLALCEADRTALAEIEYAGDGAAWAVWAEPGQGQHDIVHVSDKGKVKQGIAIGRPTMLYAENLTILDDGCVALWTQNKQHFDADALILATLPEPIEDHVSILPLSYEGLPMALPTHSIDLLNALGGKTLSRLQVQVRDLSSTSR